MTKFGPFFAPLALYWVVSKGRHADRLTFVRAFKAVPWNRHGTTILWIMCCALAVSHVVGSWNRYLSFGADWDLAIYSNACANALHSSFRNHTSLLADHFEPFLWLLVPGCELFPPQQFLLAVQALGLLVGAVGIFMLAGTVTSELATKGTAALLYMLFAGHVHLIYWDFHLIALSLAFVPWLFWCFVTDRRRWFMCLALVYCGLKETAALTIFGFGLLALAQRRWSFGIPVSLVFVAIFFLIMQVIYPHYRQGAESEYFAKYYGHLGSSMGEILTAAWTSPARILASVTTSEKISYLVMTVGVPFLFVHLRKPWFLLPIAPALLINVLSDHPHMFSGAFHYEAEIFPLLFSSLVIVASPRALSWVFVFIAIVLSGHGFNHKVSLFKPDLQHQQLAVELKKLNVEFASCRVAAVERVATHLATIPQVTLLDEWHLADVVIVAYPRQGELWKQSVEDIENTIVPRLKDYQLRQPLPFDPQFRIWIRPNAACVGSNKG